MHHKLDFHPIPTDVLYVNELSLAGKAPYETKRDMDKALTGRTKSNGGILPDDNARIYVPMDLNADIILCGSYIRCIAHLTIPPKRMNLPIVPVSEKLSCDWKSTIKCGQQENWRILCKKKMAVCGTSIRASNLQSKS